MLPGFQSIPQMLDAEGKRVFFQAINELNQPSWFDPVVGLEQIALLEIFSEAERGRIMASDRPTKRLALEWVGKRAACWANAWSGKQELNFQDYEIWYDQAGAPGLRFSRGNCTASEFGEIAISMSTNGSISLGVSAVVAPLLPEHFRSSESQILGIGVDVVAFKHLEGVPEGIWQTVLRHTFTPLEIEQSSAGKDRAEVVKLLSAVFAGKEAVFKSLSRMLYQEWSAGSHPGETAIDFRRIEIPNAAAGQSLARLPDSLRQVMQHYGENQISLWFFFESEFVVALALCCRDNPIL